MSEKKVILKKGKERSISLNRHPWIFSGAIDSYSENIFPGDMASIYSIDGKFLAQGYFQLENSLAGRIVSFDRRPLSVVIREKIQKALTLRKALLDFTRTNCFRLIHAEEDGLPGLIIDCYDNVLVMQISTAGMEKLKKLVVECLIQEIHPRSIYEKSTSKARDQEGLEPLEGFLFGERVEEVLVKEEGITFAVSIVEGQKTGFFLDQREMRKKVGELAKGRSVLNTFCYSGGFSLHALRGGASFVTSVDCCASALALCKKNSDMGSFSSRHQILQADVLELLEKDSLQTYDFVILDPPAFAKKRQDVEPALAAYRRINQAVFAKCKESTLLLTCSCSYFIDAASFQHVVFQAAAAAQREVKIILRHIQASDHPTSLFHPEGEYLKSLLLWVE